MANNLSKLDQLISSQNSVKLTHKKSRKNSDDHFFYPCYHNLVTIPNFSFRLFIWEWQKITT